MDVSIQSLDAKSEKIHSLNDIQIILNKISDIKEVPDKVFNSNTIYEISDLPFYSDIDLLVISNSDWAPLGSRLVFLKKEGELWWLNGVSPPIHIVNKSSDLQIKQDNILNYLAFFCFFVNGDEGPFFIIDQTDSQFLPKDVGESIADTTFRKPRIWGQDANGDWRVSAMVYYSNAIFYADFLVNLDGMVEMCNDIPIQADLQHKINAPLKVSGLLSS